MICFSASVKAQGQKCSISGVAYNSQGETLPGIMVLLQDSSLGAVTDMNGFFSINGLSAGTHSIYLSGLGYQRKDVPVKVAPQDKMEIIVILEESEEELGEVVVEGKTFEKEIEESGFAVNVIETKKASLQSLQTNDLLNRTAGIRVRQNGGLGSAVNYNLNGMSGNSVRIFIDGIPISTYGASFSLNSIPPALIERIEVYKGVIPAHLSDDALGGAINVILKQDMSNNLTASVSYGSFNTLQANFSSMYRNEKNGFTVRASGFHNYSDNNYEVWGKFVRNILPNGRYEYVRTRRFNDAYRSTGGQIQLGFTNVKWADQFLIGFNGSNDYNEIQHGNYMTIPYKGRFTTSQSNVLNLNYNKKDFMVKGLEVTFTGMHSDRHEVVNDTVRWNYNWFGEKSIGLNGTPILRSGGAQQGAPTINHIDRKVTTFRSGLNYDINDNHRVVFNHMYYTIDRREQDLMKTELERSFIGTRDLTKNISAVAYEMNAFNSRLKTNLFTKFYQQQIERMNPILLRQNGEQIRGEDTAKSKRNTTGYGLATSLNVLPKLMLIVSAEKAVRMPSENEIFGSPGDNIIENISLRPEISNNLNVGFRGGFLYNSDHKFDFYVSGFLRDTKDKIVQRINPRMNDAIQTDPFENLGLVKSKGFEAELKYEMGRNLNVFLNFSRFNTVFNQQYDPNGKEYTYYNQQLPNEPFFTVNNMVQYTLNDFIQTQSTVILNYNFGFVDRFYTSWMEIDEFRTPRQFIQDIGISYMFPNKKFVISADARNIFDRQAYDNFAVQKPGRAFYLKLNYTINNF
ncbi:TonB-dependent receptor [Anditalea andensis]|uniref:TonB-dependent receptor n=2 Tax=Anditalea andensis TaxID=1048983 RepID=A0A074KPP7_9BACT|nr:TonB-dependent receptor [Anditalea andensis]